MFFFPQKMEKSAAFSRQVKGLQQDKCYHLNGGLVQEMEALHFETTLFMCSTSNGFKFSMNLCPVFPKYCVPRSPLGPQHLFPNISQLPLLLL